MQMVPERHLNNRSLSFAEFSRRYQALLHAADLASQRGLPELMQELTKLLHEVFNFNSLSYALSDTATGVMHLYMLTNRCESQNARLSFP